VWGSCRLPSKPSCCWRIMCGTCRLPSKLSSSCYWRNLCGSCRLPAKPSSCWYWRNLCGDCRLPFKFSSSSWRILSGRRDRCITPLKESTLISSLSTRAFVEFSARICLGMRGENQACSPTTKAEFLWDTISTSIPTLSYIALGSDIDRREILDPVP